MALDPSFVADVVAPRARRGRRRRRPDDAGDRARPARARARRSPRRQPGVLFGLDAASAAFAQARPRRAHRAARRRRASGASRRRPCCASTGDAAALLTAERTALNFLQRLSGVATLTARYVRAVEGTGAQVLDTRKTTPGLRLLEKAAVRRRRRRRTTASGLFDVVLIKENHAAMAGGVGAAVRAARAGAPGRSRWRSSAATAAEVDEALEAGAPRILLDNMTPGADARDRRPASTGAPSSRPAAASTSRRSGTSRRPG